MATNGQQMELTVLMPCLNEAETLAVCIDKARTYMANNGISGEILVSDNGSTDGSQQIAIEHGARVIDVPERGYGAALIAGCNAAYGKYVIMGDADDSYDFTALAPFIERLRSGDDLVVGNRFEGGIEKGAMPPLHKYVGNPILSRLGRIFFKCPIRDFHCGLRGYNTKRMRELGLRTTGMEYASEMVVQATINGYRVTEVPTTLSPDGRSRPPHLRSWRDGWRHLKFLLIHSPNWLFLYPGLALIIVGIVLGASVIITQPSIFGASLSINSLLYSAVMVIVGFNLVLFQAYTKIYARNARFIKVESNFFSRISSEKCVLFGLAAVLFGITLTLLAIVLWGRESFGELVPESFMRLTIPAMTLIVTGIQLLFSGFFIEILRITVSPP